MANGDNNIDGIKVSISEKIRGVVRDELSEYDCPTGRVHSEAINNLKGNMRDINKKTDSIFKKIDGINGTLIGIAGAVILELIGIILVLLQNKYG